MARASVAAGADALLIEVHSDPDKALSDGAQSLFPEQFRKLMDELRIIAPAVGRTLK
jgi:3-deoxy-7-phosphoheptulonate synthase